MQVRDPLWFLARQWQAGEFMGHDAGSPVLANFQLETTPLSSYGVGVNATPNTPLQPALPLEVHVERENVLLGLRGSVQLGLYFENLLRSSGLWTQVCAAFRAAYTIPQNPSSDEVYDPAALQFRALVANRVTDGNALYADLKAVNANPNAKTSLPNSAKDSNVQSVLNEFYSYVQGVYSQPSDIPAGDSAWVSDRLHYEFAVGSQSTQPNLVLDAPEFTGGTLDWFSFDFQSAPAISSASPTSFSMLPTHISFRGMPTTKWWYFDESEIDFGSLDTEKVDLLKMLIAELALVYGNDWFQLPVPTPMGSFNKIANLIVTDSFGVRTQINPADVLDQAQPRPWSFFAISGTAGYSSFLLLPPILDRTVDGPVLEDVLFLRDEIADMAWAVEKTLQGPLNSPQDGLEAYYGRLQRAKQETMMPNPSQSTAQTSNQAADISYLLGTAVPDNWIPMVRVQTTDGSVKFRRGVVGTVEEPTNSGFVTAKGYILEPSHAFYVGEQEIPRAGTEVSRYFRRTRTSDGSTFIWMARKTRTGKGPGWSGLAFDLIVPAGSVLPSRKILSASGVAKG